MKPKRKRKLKERFFEKVNKNGPIHPILKTKCWLWTASTSHGYGLIGYNGKLLSPHRVIYQNLVQPIPVGLSVLHKCDNPSCVNPDHLFLGTHADNMQDMANKGRSNKGKPNLKNKGENHGMAKLTQKQVKAIRFLYKNSPMSQKELAEKFGVHQVHISRIVLRKR